MDNILEKVITFLSSRFIIHKGAEVTWGAFLLMLLLFLIACISSKIKKKNRTK